MKLLVYSDLHLDLCPLKLQLAKYAGTQRG